jgi:hypothetical protein
MGNGLLNDTPHGSIRDRLTCAFGVVLSRCFFARFGTPE